MSRFAVSYICVWTYNTIMISLFLQTSSEEQDVEWPEESEIVVPKQSGGVS